jgi:SAM-dependent methyltransferase
MNGQARGDRHRNPHFDDLRQVWSDQWSGQYVPPPRGYWAQFNEKGALWKDNYVSHVMPHGMRNHFAGPSAEWLAYNTTSFVEKTGGSFNLDRPFERSFFRDRTILDIACGLGRWTHVMLNLGARKVVSLDISPVAVEVVKTVNPNSFEADIFDLVGNRTYAAEFEFTLAWGVLMHTHDPRLAFLNAASTVRRNGSLYVYVYGEDGFHASPQFNVVRKTFHALATFEERIAFAERTLPAATLPGTNIKNLLGWYDALCPFYNWTIPLEVVAHWYRDHAFRNITLLNRNEVVGNSACGYHVLGELGATDKPVFHAELEEILAVREANRRRCEAQEAEDNLKLEKYRKGRLLPLKGFRREVGNCYTVALPGGAELKRLFLYENETPLLPGDAMHDTIRTDGKGSYSVWPAGKQCALYMSTSDNTDPNRNGRTYSLRYATPGGYSPAPRRLRWPSRFPWAG